MTFAEQLKSQLNIVEVVGQYVRLKRQGAGGRYVGLCPFHSEKTPSFGVLSTLQIYKCFGCGVGGDVFNFVMEREGLTFPETLKFLAERNGIPVPERERASDPEAQRRAALFEMHEIAADVFQSNLRGAMGTEARKYLESRGVSRAAIDEFRLGLSDASGQQLVQRLQKFGPALLEESGLVAKWPDSNRLHDRFQARLMFPIHNESGKLIAFGGRALRADHQPKYLNSPETKTYKKSTVLYNLHRAKMDARKFDRMILVEGYMDVIGVYSAGIHEVVASSGTSLGQEQVRAMKRQVAQQQASTGQIILNFDSDAAGERSTEKYIAPLLAEGLRVKVLAIPGGLDADEYIQQNGGEAYRGLADRASSYFHWLADHTRSKFDMRTAEGRVDAFNHLMPTFQLVHDRLDRGAIITEMAEYLRVDRELISSKLGAAPRAQTTQKSRDAVSAVPPNEKLLLSCLLCSADARAAIQQYFRSTNIVHLLELKSIFQTALALEDEGIAFGVEALESRLDTRMQKILSELSFQDGGVAEQDAVQQALHCLKALEAQAARAERDAMKRRIQELERAGNFEEALLLADELNRVKSASLGG